MRKLITLLFGALLLLAGLPAQAQLSEPYVSQATGISFPVNLASFRLMRITDFEPRQRGLGVGVYYNNPSPFVAVDVFIYDKAGAVPSGHEPAAIRAEASQAVEDIHTVAASGLYADVRVQNDPSPCRIGGVAFQCANLTYLRTPKDQAAVATRSRVLLRGVKGQFFKIRISWPQAADAQAAPLADRWLESFVRLLPN